jgi:predicted naringenin-chalcone synthase
MPVALHAIGTATPPHRYPQPFVRQVMGAWVGGERRTDKLLDRVYAASAIDARHSVLADFLPERPSDVPTPFLGPSGAFRSPSTGERNALYAVHAPQLAEQAARRTFEVAGGLLPADVTHLITVSCTGFYTPGVDLHLVEALGLRSAVERYHLGFMGCFAAFPALRMAKAFCLADPQAVVLVVTVELCTLHLQPRADVDSILAASVFADGAAGVLVSARPPNGPQRPLALEHAATAVTREGANDMAWTIGDHGFDMTLSAYVPRILAAEGAEAMAPLFEAAALDPASVRWWAVHPGGRAIVDKLVQAMGLQEPMVAASRAVLREAGNMSSVTVLFVLQQLMQRNRPGPEVGEPLVAVAFGPGLTVDSALLRAL